MVDTSLSSTSSPLPLSTEEGYQDAIQRTEILGDPSSQDMAVEARLRIPKVQQGGERSRGSCAGKYARLPVR